MLAFLLGVPRDASAYLDPGTGSYLLQMALAGVFAAAFTLKMYWRKLKGFVSRRKSDPPAI
jgi:hypothetical protein